MMNINMNKVAKLAKVVAEVVVEETKTGATAVAKVAKKEFDRRYQKNDDQIMQMVLAEVRMHDWSDYEVTVEAMPDGFTESHANCGDAKWMGGIAGITKPMEKVVTFYVSNLRKTCNTFFFMNTKKLIERVVRHENRHTQQFEYIREKKGDAGVVDALRREMFAIYGTSALERDAIAYQGGKEQNLDDVLASYLA